MTRHCEIRVVEVGITPVFVSSSSFQSINRMFRREAFKERKGLRSR